MDRDELLNIKVKITDSEALQRLTPDAIQSYVREVGYVEEENPPWVNHLAQSYTLPALKDVYLVVPCTTTQLPYPLRVYDVLSALAAYKGRSQLAVYVDILAHVQEVDHG